MSPTASASPATPSSTSSSAAPAIPKIWRNDSLTRARLTITTTTTSSSIELGTFAVNPLGARFSEDFTALGSLNSHPPRQVCFADTTAAVLHAGSLYNPPRAPTPFAHDNPTARRLCASILEMDYYPIYPGYERLDFIRAVGRCIDQLHKLRAGFEQATLLFNAWNRFWQLCEYRQLHRRVTRLIPVLKELAALFRAIGVKGSAQYEKLPVECRVLKIVVEEWLAKADRRLEQMIMQGAGWRSKKCRRLVILGMRGVVGELAAEVKESVLERVEEVVVMLRDVEAKGFVVVR